MTTLNKKQTSAINTVRTAVSVIGSARDNLITALDKAHAAKCFEGCEKAIDVLAVIYENLPKGISSPVLPKSEHYSEKELGYIRNAYQYTIRAWCIQAGITAPAKPRAPSAPKAKKAPAAQSPVAMTINAPAIGAPVSARLAFVTSELKELSKDFKGNADKAALLKEAMELIAKLGGAK
jgi:hypothetical protein